MGGMGMDEREIRNQIARLIGPLRAIFWGGILCAIDLKVKSGSSSFDLLNDLLGKILITLGVFRLWTFPVTRSYGRGMGLVVLVSILSTLKTAAKEFGIQKPPDLEVLWTAWEFVELGAVLLFCVAMRLVCRRTGLTRPEQSWQTTTLLYLVFFALPIGAVHAISLASTLTGRNHSIDVGPWGLVFLLVILIPGFHFFVSTSRMKRAAQSAS